MALLPPPAFALAQVVAIANKEKEKKETEKKEEQDKAKTEPIPIPDVDAETRRLIEDAKEKETPAFSEDEDTYHRMVPRPLWEFIPLARLNAGGGHYVSLTGGLTKWVIPPGEAFVEHF